MIKRGGKRKRESKITTAKEGRRNSKNPKRFAFESSKHLKMQIFSSFMAIYQGQG